MFVKVTVLAVLAVSVYAGIFDGVNGITSDAGNFFSDKFRGVQDLFASDYKGLENNIQRVKDLLIGVKEKAKTLEPLANDAQKETLRNVDSFLGKVTNFQNDVTQQGQAKFEENKNKWQSIASDIFDKGGLGSVLKLLNANSSPSYSYAAIVAPILYMLLIR